MTRLRFTVTLPTDRVERPDEFGTAGAVMEMAKAAEDADFDACNVSDHPFPPSAWIQHGGHHTLDPLVALSFAGAVTTNLRLHTNIYVPAYRNPFLTAKAVATLDALTGGRVIFGVAAGYLRGEFDALGMPFEGRGARLDTALLAMQQAWTGEPVEMQTQHWAAHGNVMLPRPLTRPHPTIWVGGNSTAAMRRVVRLGQGWIPFPAQLRLAKAVGTEAIESIADLAARIRRLGEMATEAAATTISMCAAHRFHSSSTNENSTCPRSVTRAINLPRLVLPGLLSS